MTPAKPAGAALTAAARLTWQGADVVVTVTADDPAILARRLDRALAAFGASVETTNPAAPMHAARHAETVEQRAPARASVQAAAGPICAQHGQPLTWRTPKGGGPGWYSHRTADGGWCRG